MVCRIQTLTRSCTSYPSSFLTFQRQLFSIIYQQLKAIMIWLFPCSMSCWMPPEARYCLSAACLVLTCCQVFKSFSLPPTCLTSADLPLVAVHKWCNTVCVSSVAVHDCVCVCVFTHHISVQDSCALSAAGG